MAFALVCYSTTSNGYDYNSKVDLLDTHSETRITNNIPSEMTSRASQLTALARKVRVLETQLANTLHGKEALKKWQWPAEALQIVSQLQDLARKNNALVRGPLDRLLEWPNPASADLKLFLGGKPGFEAFDRAENWFEQMGFDQYSTPYTFSSAWDKRLMKAMILVPKGLQAGTKVPVMWFFHGGGFVRTSFWMMMMMMMNCMYESLG
jgi:hypothetical protein